MYSFDHDLEEFVAIGLGTVTEDGSVVATNSGVGVIKAGWHCGSQPANSGCVSGKGCPLCKKSATNDCNNNDCVDDQSKAELALPAEQQTPGDCQTATCGGSVAADDKPADVKGDCNNPSCVAGVAYLTVNNKDLPDNRRGDCKKPICVNGLSNYVRDQSMNGQPVNTDQCCYNGKIVSNTIAELSQCPNRVDNPDHTPGFNGCGGSGLSSAVPDNPMWVNLSTLAYNALHSISDGDFTQSCNEHDECYDKCNRNKSSCDSSFGSSMDSVCHSDYSGALSSVYLLECLAFSWSYESTVSIGIDSFYDNAQSNACNCCQ